MAIYFLSNVMLVFSFAVRVSL